MIKWKNLILYYFCRKFFFFSSVSIPKLVNLLTGTLPDPSWQIKSIFNYWLYSRYLLLMRTLDALPTAPFWWLQRLDSIMTEQRLIWLFSVWELDIRNPTSISLLLLENCLDSGHKCSLKAYGKGLFSTGI